MPDSAPAISAKIFGDFQTPDMLAAAAISCLKASCQIEPASVIEPSCGKGAFLQAALDGFPKVTDCLAVEINHDYHAIAQARCHSTVHGRHIRVHQGDFFDFDWPTAIAALPEPILIIGNPPWVTNAQLGTVNGLNIPQKTNFQNRSGLEAITGKANFDISEWMILQYLEWLADKKGIIAVLCKTAVARKVLLQRWRKQKPVAYAALYQIDALSSFGAAVDACFFVLNTDPELPNTHVANIYSTLEDKHICGQIGYRDGVVLSDMSAYLAGSALIGKDSRYVWRSGIKHDCSRIMELDYTDGKLVNGLGQIVDIEDDVRYPLFKSSDVAHNRLNQCRKEVIVTQKYVGEETSKIAYSAPRAWAYLKTHQAIFQARKSVIYQRKPPFSIFGVGEYSFAPWKVAISALYKKLSFCVIAPINNRPAQVDDTVYFLSCYSGAEARFVCDLLNSDVARNFLQSMIFWQDKRPITIDILKRLSLEKLAIKLDCHAEYRKFSGSYPTSCSDNNQQQAFAFS